MAAAAAAISLLAYLHECAHYLTGRVLWRDRAQLGMEYSWRDGTGQMSVGELRDPGRADLLRLAAVTVAGQLVTLVGGAVAVWYLTAGVVGWRTSGDAFRTTFCAVIIIDFCGREIKSIRGGDWRELTRILAAWRAAGDGSLPLVESSRAGDRLMMELRPNPREWILHDQDGWRGALAKTRAGAESEEIDPEAAAVELGVEIVAELLQPTSGRPTYLVRRLPAEMQ